MHPSLPSPPAQSARDDPQILRRRGGIPVARSLPGIALQSMANDRHALLGDFR